MAALHPSPPFGDLTYYPISRWIRGMRGKETIVDSRRADADPAAIDTARRDDQLAGVRDAGAGERISPRIGGGVAAGG
jgi:hypothetical protein